MYVSTWATTNKLLYNVIVQGTVREINVGKHVSNQSKLREQLPMLTFKSCNATINVVFS